MIRCFTFPYGHTLVYALEKSWFGAPSMPGMLMKATNYRYPDNDRGPWISPNLIAPMLRNYYEPYEIHQSQYWS